MRGIVRASAAAIALFSAVTLSACTEPAVVDVGECVTTTDATRLPVGADWVLGLGVVQDDVLLLYSRFAGDRDLDVYAQWFDGDLSASGDPTYLGRGRANSRSELVPEGECLVGQVWAVDPEREPESRWLSDNVRLWRFCPGRAPESFGMLTGLVRETPAGVCTDCDIDDVSLSTANLGAGAQGRLPVIARPLGPLAGLGAVPDECDEAIANFRLLLFGAERQQFVTWGEGACFLGPNVDLGVSNMKLVALSGERIGVFLRLGVGVGAGHVHYLVVDDDLQLVEGPRQVGASISHFVPDGGYQPNAAAVGSGRVLFNERIADSANSCQSMRSIREDGTGAAATPWQLPCIAEPGEYLTRSNAMVGLPDGNAAIVWAERSAFGRTGAFTTEITRSTEWEEGIHVALLNDRGQRGSDVLRVTDPGATALGSEPRDDSGPFPGDFLVYLGADGEDLVVGWSDSRPSAPGFYARRVTCTATTAD